MQTHLLPSSEWAQLEFGAAPLHDARYAKRLVNIGDHLAAQPGGTLPQAFAEWAELKGAYRFFADPRNGFEQIQAAHRRRVRQECGRPAEYLLVEDTTRLDYTGRCCEDMGLTDQGGRGFFLHTTLAVRVESWNLNQRPEGVAIGLLDQQCLNRRQLYRHKGLTRRQTQERQRESDRWASVLQEVSPRRHPGCQWTYIADREADFYEPMQRCVVAGVDFVIRAFQDRRLAESTEHYLEKVAQGPVAGTMAVELRARPGCAARTAVVEVRCLPVSLQGPYRGGQRMESLTANVIEVREKSPPPGVEELYWVLLTSLSCQRWSEIQRIVGRYCARWWVEEYHKALKSGAGVEASQLERQHRIESLVAVLAVVAVRLLNLKMLARAQPDQAVDAELFGPTAIKLVERRFGAPKQGHWTNRELLRAIARVGGFIGRRGDGEPGWQNIWRGWQRLMWMSEGVELINHR